MDEPGQPPGQTEAQTQPQQQPPAQPQWNFRQEGPTTGAPAASSDVAAVQWTASEYIEHEKSAGWYLAFIVGTVLIGVLAYLLSDLVATVLVVIGALTFGAFAARKPRELTYRVDDRGINVGEKFYPYNSFKSFALMQEGSLGSIWFMPLKRFMPILTVYFAPDDANKIVDTVSNFLPIQDRQPDPIDQLIHRLRF